MNELRNIQTVDGDTVDGLLYQHLGDYSHETEEAFYLLNPGVTARGVVLKSGVSLVLPEPVAATPKKRFSVWD